MGLLFSFVLGAGGGPVENSNIVHFISHSGPNNLKVNLNSDNSPNPSLRRHFGPWAVVSRPLRV